MRTLIIQLVLIAATGAIVWRFLSGVGQRSQAVRRIALLVFGVLAVASILFPETWTMAANFIGVGRGTDLILYMLVVAFFSFMATPFKRSRDADIRYTKLARRLALDEAVRDGRIKPGHVVLMEALGGGFSWGAALARW